MKHPDMSVLRLGIEKMNEELNKFKETYRTRLQADFTNAIESIFKEVPGLEWIKWTQGTPGFCDGDPCSFEIHNLYIFLDGEEYDYNNDLEYGLYTQEEIDAFSERKKQWGYVAATEEQLYAKNVGDLVNGILQTVEGILSDIYGDPSEITINRDGRSTVNDFKIGY